jgi:hypothetical protein
MSTSIVWWGGLATLLAASLLLAWRSRATEKERNIIDRFKGGQYYRREYDRYQSR